MSNPWRHYKKRPQILHAKEMAETFSVETVEGIMTGGPGDFLICGLEGEHYPCKRSVFLAVYEEVLTLDDEKENGT